MCACVSVSDLIDDVVSKPLWKKRPQRREDVKERSGFGPSIIKRKMPANISVALKVTSDQLLLF